MAYPFPRFTSVPNTPHYLQAVESPRTKAALPKSMDLIVCRRLVIFGIIVSGAVLWMISSFTSTSLQQPDRVSFARDLTEDFFAHYEGHQDCGIMSNALYTPQDLRDEHGRKINPFCRNRATLLEAMSGGGRHGFDAPFFPSHCHYRWYSAAEICLILDRFDTIVFLGDTSLQHVYAAFNMLLRENIAMGALKQWEMKESERSACRCDSQLVNSECAKHMVLDSRQVEENDGSSGHISPYYCDRVLHLFLPINNSPAPDALLTTFTSILSKNRDSYKPVPVIHSISLSTSLAWSTATASMDEWLALSDASSRNVPFLWVGPNAAGHLKPPGQILSQGNNALWHYTVEMAKEAKTRGLDALGMYNLTLQAASWDGSNYGQKVALVQAMMASAPGA